MTLRLSEWASIAEIVSGLAVVVTLIFLIFGIRENTEVTRAAAYGGIFAEVNEMALTIAKDDALAGIWESYRAGESNQLSDSDKFRLGTLLRNLLRIYEWAYYSNQYGTLGSAEWDRFERRICVERETVDQEQWEYVERILTEEFSRYISRRCPN